MILVTSNQGWDDYTWHEADEFGTFSLDIGDEEGDEELVEMYSVYQPTSTRGADLAKYLSELVFWLRAEGGNSRGTRE